MKRSILTFDLVTQAPMHIGSGTYTTVVEDGKELKVAEYVTDAYQRPWVPGSTVKGMFRSLINGNNAPALFGTAHGVTGQKGRVVFKGFTTKVNVTPIILTQTAIDRGTGASDPNKLYKRQWVPSGTPFHGELVLDIRDGEDLLPQILSLLSGFRRPEGIPIGRNKADMSGALTLVGEIGCEEETLGATGWTTKALPNIAVSPEPSPTDLLDLVLFCRGPFHSFGRKELKSSSSSERALTRRRTGSDEIDVPTPGISGAIRARAEWLLATLPPNLCPDEQELETSSGPKKLNVVKRLFGHEGYRAGLIFRSKVLKSDPPVDVTGVPIDRFSALPMGTGPYTVEAVTGVELRIRAQGFRDISTHDRAFLKRVAEDIRTHGITLGKGASRGFGWFESITQGNAEGGKGHVCVVDMLNKTQSLRIETLKTGAFSMKEQGRSTREFMVVAKSKNYSDNEIASVIADVFDSSTPDPRITLPYRHIFYDPKSDKYGKPEPAVGAAYKNHQLHKTPLPDGLSGTLDVTWRFERNMAVLDNARNVMRMAGHYVIPGATVRGNIRAILEAVTASRMTQVDFPDDVAGWPGKTGLTEAMAKAAKGQDIQAFEPDFVQALFGFVNVNKGQKEERKGLHGDLHLKSRLLFDVAWGRLEDDLTPVKQKISLEGPNPASKIYSHIGWKRYPIDADTQTFARMISQNSGSAGMESTFELLEADPINPLDFRGRIAFHNVTPAELGALLWAVTWDADRSRRHKIGFCKPFGAGICSVRDLRLHLRPHKDEAHFADANEMLALIGNFREYLRTQGLFNTQAYKEMLASAKPGVIVDHSVYQIWSSQHARGRMAVESVANDATAMAAQGGRVTAMLKKVT